MPEHKLSPKESRGGFHAQTLKCGRRRYGELRHYTDRESGQPFRIYWALRKPEEFFFTLGAWAFDVATIQFLRAVRPNFIGVEVKDGRKFLMRFDRLDAAAKRTADLTPDQRAMLNKDGMHLNYSKRGGALQFYVFADSFVQNSIPQDVSEAYLLRDLTLGGRRKR
jgi:hypothetical protein